MSTIDVSLCVNTFQKPWHLHRLLASIAAQQGVTGRFELVVSDDGSTDETADVVDQFRRRVRFPVSFTTHPRTGYHVARVRNDGARATTAPYLLFLDGDCVLPPDHVAVHLGRRRDGCAMVGDCYRIEEEQSAVLSEEGAARGEFLRWDMPHERRRLNRLDRKMRLYSLLRHPRRPKLVSNNVGIWRRDFDRVNGFDENFRGWGAEDDDLGRRLKRAGVRLKSILGWTQLYHLWHPRDPSATPNWNDGANAGYIRRPGWLTRCRNGLVARPLADLSIGVVGRADRPAIAAELWRRMNLPPSIPLEGLPASASPAVACVSGLPDQVEVEVLFFPGKGRFSGRAECNVLVVLDESDVPRRLLGAAHRIVAGRQFPGLPADRQFPLNELHRALDSIT
jgi:glycosyltransferase involved in cell wall biosynthesis